MIRRLRAVSLSISDWQSSDFDGFAARTYAVLIVGPFALGALARSSEGNPYARLYVGTKALEVYWDRSGEWRLG